MSDNILFVVLVRKQATLVSCIAIVILVDSDCNQVKKGKFKIVDFNPFSGRWVWIIG